MNYMKQVAEMLGVEIGERFKIRENGKSDTYYFEDRGLICKGLEATQVYQMEMLLTGKKTIVKLPWKPKEGEEYWYVAHGWKYPGEYDVECDEFNSRSLLDVSYLAFGNCFRTEAEAEAHKDEILQKMKEVLGE